MIQSVAASVLILALCAPVFGAETAVLAIMDFVPEEISYQKASDISHIIRHEMRNLAGFRVLNRVQMVNSLGADIECADVACAVQAGKKMGAGKVIIGTIRRSGANKAITGRLIDVQKQTVEVTAYDRSISPDDDQYMVERFCDKIAKRLTGKPLYKNDGGVTNDASRHVSDYRPAADPTAWLALGAGIVSGVGFLQSTMYYETEMMFHNDDMQLNQFLLFVGADPDFPDPGLQIVALLGMQNARNDLAHKRKVRNTGYYAAAGIGGFAGLMLTVFIGRNIADAVQSGSRNRPGGVSLVFPPQYADTAPAGGGRWRPGFGLGLAMHF